MKRKTWKVQLVFIDLWNISQKNFELFLTKIIEISFDNAKKLSKENMPKYSKYYENELLSTINSCLIKISNSKDKDLFYFLANVFFNLLVTHKLPNGNKRIAISILIKFLYYFGYYFKFQKNDYESNRDWEEKSISFISRAESKKENEENIINDIRNWILKNILIALNIK